MSHAEAGASPAEQTQEISVNGNMLKKCLPTGRQLRVCVVGAGVAGLRASDHLLRRGVDVTIYEARDRVGGRLAQSDHLGHLVDLGPNWIHGTVDNPIYDMARKLGTVLHSWEERQAAFDEDGSRISEKDAYETSAMFWDIIADAYQFSKENTHVIPASESLMDFVEKKADKNLSSETDKDVAKRKRRLLMREAEMWGAFVGSAIRTQSLKFFWLEDCLEGETPFVAETYKKILDNISKPASDRAKLKLEHAVTRIDTEWQERKGSDVVVDTRNGSTETFDEIILTCPLGWLKRNKSIFNPPLPNRLTEAIDTVSYGSLDKVYITFPSAFWNPPATTNGSSTHSPRHQSATTPPDQAPPSSTQEPPKRFPSLMQWFHPAYARDTNPSGWNQQGLDLAALPGPTAHPTLLYYIFGDCAQHVAHLAAPHPSRRDADARLVAFFEPYFSLLPRYSAADPACMPTGVLATAWTNDEWAGHGSYCNFQVGVEDGDAAVEVMRQGMPERGVWLAGEHTAPFLALGTVTGAYQSGEGVARRICEVYGLEKAEQEEEIMH